MPRPSGAAAGRSRTTRWQTTAERTWNTDGLRHRVDVYADALHERVASTASPNALGTFAYASPADLAAGRPASFERALGGRVAEASAWKAVLALSDAYQPPRLPGPLGILSTDGLTVQYGVRVDAEWFGGTRAESPLVRARFGRSTARLPAGVAAQPMAGFTWTRGVTVTQSGPARFSPVRHFAPDTRFALAEEGGRPVFAGRADVVPATGAVTAAGSRAMPELGSVLELRSDGRSTQRRGTAGLPYTPVVGGDLNGDGLANDRAFVFDPAAADSALGAGMRRLLDGGRRRVRDCLARQLGAVAAEASCRGPR